MAGCVIMSMFRSSNAANDRPRVVAGLRIRMIKENTIALDRFNQIKTSMIKTVTDDCGRWGYLPLQAMKGEAGSPSWLGFG